jgi:hypothetical protein
VREKLHDLLEKGRIKDGPFATAHGDRFGVFALRFGASDCRLHVIYSDGADWSEIGLAGPAFEHASVTVRGQKRCPTWEEMCFVKSLIWGDTEWVLQYHPPAKDNVSVHDFCLHLWRPIGVEIPTPDPLTIGPRTVKAVLDD